MTRRPVLRLALLLTLAAAPAAAADSQTVDLGAQPQATPALRVTVANGAGVPVSAVIAGGQLRVIGTVRPYVGDQSVIVRTSRAGAPLEARRRPWSTSATASGGSPR